MQFELSSSGVHSAMETLNLPATPPNFTEERSYAPQRVPVYYRTERGAQQGKRRELTYPAKRYWADLESLSTKLLLNHMYLLTNRINV